MNLLIVTPHFFPENFKVNDLAFELSRRGHNITVLTAIPDYPEGHFYKGYGIFKKRKEKIKGVTVIHTTIIPRFDGSAKWLVLNYLSYAIFSTIRSIILSFTKNFDAIIVHETSPMMVGIPAVIVKKIQRIPIHFWVLDLWPESLQAAGGINSPTILRPFKALSRWIYKNSKTILVSSKGFSKSINKLGNFNHKIKYYPNWTDVTANSAQNFKIPEFPSGFNVLFAGNIGDAQDMPSLVECAKLLKDRSINFILVGDGRKKNYVETCRKKYGLTNIYTFGRFPKEAMLSFFSKADALFLSLKDEPIFSLTVPAKLQAYMASGKPVVAMINGEGADLIDESECGWSVRAGDYISLANLLTNLSTCEKDVLKEKGQNGMKYSLEHFDFNTAIDNLEQIILNTQD